MLNGETWERAIAHQPYNGDNILMTWQPIDTAPKDPHQHIMIYVPNKFNHEYFVVRWNPYDFGGIWQIGSSLAVIGKDLPSHWMPLPEPPKLP